MGFRENLKSELAYADVKVKELAKISGIKKSTIDSYLRENSYMPSAETAVCIANALGVSVEYLVKGQEPPKNRALAALNSDLRLLLRALEKLNMDEREVVIKNAVNLADALIDKNSKREAHG